MLPNFLIIGAQKAGTTSLWSYLRAHPDIFMPERKELDFFARQDWRDNLDWYQRQFDGANTPAIGEASPTYSCHFPSRPHDVSEAVAEVLPDAKLIYLVRDPIDRAASAWVQHTAVGFEKRPIDEALCDVSEPDNLYVAASSYAAQLRRYLRHFSAENVYVEDAENLRFNRGAVLTDIFTFLRVDPTFTSDQFDIELNTADHQVGITKRAIVAAKLVPPDSRLRRPESKAGVRLREAARRAMFKQIDSRPEVSSATREVLAGTLQADTDDFRAITGKSFSSWSV